MNTICGSRKPANQQVGEHIFQQQCSTLSWGQSCDHPWHSSGGLPASMFQPSGGGKWKGWRGKMAQSSSSTNTSHTHKLRFNWYRVFEVWFWYLYCSFRVRDLTDCLWLKIKTVSKTERDSVGPNYCLKFCDSFHTFLSLLVGARRALLLTEGNTCLQLNVCWCF